MERDSITFNNPFIAGQNLIVPNLLKYLARRELKRLCPSSRNKDIDFEKAEDLLESFLTRNTVNEQTGQQPSYALSRHITSKPFWEANDSPLLRSIAESLSNNLELIHKEYQYALKARGHKLTQSIKTGERFLDKGTWQNFTLGRLGRYSLKAKELFPKTTELLIPFQNRIFSAEIIAMEPDTVLPPHTDATNAYLVAHLGLEVPSNCGLQVKKEIRDFHRGDIVFFDQSFVHSAWNKGDSLRVNLLITFFHPEINDDEIQLLLHFVKQLKKKVILFSPLIALEYLMLKVFAVLKI